MNGRFSHGHAWNGITPTYTTWANLKQRCTNPKLACYTVYNKFWYAPWETFERFLVDMGERPPGTMIDRRDNKKGYGPKNSRWTTRTVQNQNRSNTLLTRADVRAIRRSKLTNKVLAVRYGKSPSTISAIRNRVTYTNF